VARTTFESPPGRMCFSSSITSTSVFAPSASRPNVRVVVRTVAAVGKEHWLHEAPVTSFNYAGKEMNSAGLYCSQWMIPQ
jgi:hypothetical protein